MYRRIEISPHAIMVFSSYNFLYADNEEGAARTDCARGDRDYNDYAWGERRRRVEGKHIGYDDNEIVS